MYAYLCSNIRSIKSKIKNEKDENTTISIYGFYFVYFSFVFSCFLSFNLFGEMLCCHFTFQDLISNQRASNISNSSIIYTDWTQKKQNKKLSFSRLQTNTFCSSFSFFTRVQWTSSNESVELVWFSLNGFKIFVEMSTTSWMWAASNVINH